MLKARLESALREKEAAEQTLFYVIDMFPRSPHSHLSAGTEASTQLPQSSFGTMTENSSDKDTKPEPKPEPKQEALLTPKTEDLLDETPKLDLTIRGTKTTHDIDLEPLVPQTGPATHHQRGRQYRDHHYRGQHHQDQSPPPSFFLYGIQYHPSNTMGTFRQVIVTGLPFGVQAYSLLNQVRGGMIVSCQILNTFKLTGSFSALIRFAHEAEAMGFANHTISHPMVFGNHKATADLINTSSYPLSNELHRNILNKYTRCLKVEGFTHNPMRRLQEVCQTEVVVESVRLTPGAGALIVHFTSIQQASEAYYSLKNTFELASAKYSFLADPCVQPYPGNSASSPNW